MTNTETINTNMRKGFTMIELIFVIVIIGILAAVAIPKLAGTSTEAKKAIVTSFIGTMNRTVGPTMYAKALGTNVDGNITATNGADICKDYADYIDLPNEITGFTNECVISSNLGGAGLITFVPGNANKSPRWDLNNTAWN